MNGDDTNLGANRSHASPKRPNPTWQSRNDGMIRTFIAIDLPSSVQDALATLQDNLKSAIRSQMRDAAFRWSATQNLHLTLRFLGDTTPLQRDEVVSRLRVLLATWQPLRLDVDVSGQALGGFPNLRQPRVLWSGVAGEVDRLRRLQAGVELVAREVGFVPETKAYSPHLTLARSAREADGHVIAQAARMIEAYIQQQPTAATMSFVAESITFYQSELRAGGSVYTPLAVLPLTGG